MGLLLAASIASMTLLAISSASAQTFTVATKTSNRIEGVLTVSKQMPVIIVAHFDVRGNGNQTDPNARAEIEVGGQQCGSQSVTWHDGPHSYEVTCNVTLNPGSFSVKAYEVTNTRATNEAVSLRVKSAGDNGDIAIIR